MADQTCWLTSSGRQATEQRRKEDSWGLILSQARLWNHYWIVGRRCFSMLSRALLKTVVPLWVRSRLYTSTSLPICFENQARASAQWFVDEDPAHTHWKEELWKLCLLDIGNMSMHWIQEPSGVCSHMEKRLNPHFNVLWLLVKHVWSQVLHHPGSVHLLSLTLNVLFNCYKRHREKHLYIFFICLHTVYEWTTSL